MFKSPKHVTGLEIGTSKICALVGVPGETGDPNIIGIGQARSRGVRKGEVSDPVKVEEDIRAALYEAEQMADVAIKRVYLGVTGNHIRGFNNLGSHHIASIDRKITSEDVDDVANNALVFNIPEENFVVQAVWQRFTVDGRPGIRNPVGMHGARLELGMHIVHGNASRIQNSLTMVESTQLQVEKFIFTGTAAAMAALSPDQMDLGALVIDLGAGTTDFAVFCDGILQHTGSLAVGGDHVTNDLAHGLKVPLGRAQELKERHGSALMDPSCKGRTISTTGALGSTPRQVNHEHLLRIMTARLEEIFELIENEISALGLLPRLRAGVFLCGGGARIPGITAVAGRIFQVPAVIAKNQAVGGKKAILDQPEFAAAIGLVKYGCIEEQKRPSGWAGQFGRTLQNLFNL